MSIMCFTCVTDPSSNRQIIQKLLIIFLDISNDPVLICNEAEVNKTLHTTQGSWCTIYQTNTVGYCLISKLLHKNQDTYA